MLMFEVILDIIIEAKGSLLKREQQTADLLIEAISSE